MSHLKRVSYCLSIAVFATAVATLFDSEIGWTLAFPGEFISGFLTALKSLFTTGEDFESLIPWQFASVFFYAIVFYGISWAYTGLREEREEARTQADNAVRPAN